jgi:hypothetical protein
MMQKHKFGKTCRDALFMETAMSPPEHEKWCVDVLWPGRTRMHYVTDRSHQMQKHKFSITYTGVVFMETAPGPPVHEN